MNPVLLVDDPVLTPSGEQGRTWLREELLRPEYHNDNLVQRLLGWLQDLLQRSVDTASQAPLVPTIAAIVLAVLLIAVVGWLATRPRAGAATRVDATPVLGDRPLPAAEWRRRAEQARAESRFADTVVHGFRAMAVRAIETGRIDQAPGATAHELAERIATTNPAVRGRVADSADLFDRIRYGDRPASPGDADEILRLDDELAGLR